MSDTNNKKVNILLWKVLKYKVNSNEKTQVKCFKIVFKYSNWTFSECRNIVLSTTWDMVCWNREHRMGEMQPNDD